MEKLSAARRRVVGEAALQDIPELPGAFLCEKVARTVAKVAGKEHQDRIVKKQPVAYALSLIHI